MKPFDLKQALAGKPVCTRDGRPVKIAGHNPAVMPDRCVAGWILNEIHGWHESGAYFYDRIDKRDLLLVGERRKGWIRLVMSPEGPRPIPTKVYASQTEAELAAAGDYPGKAFPEQVIQIEWED